jgi:hypothetical protein
LTAALAVVGLLAGFWPFGAGGIEVIKVSIDNGSNDKKCTRKELTGTRTLKGSAQEVLVWRVESKCDLSIQMKIKTSSAPISCVGTTGANVETQFTLAGHSKAAIACAVDYSKACDPKIKKDCPRYLVNIDIVGLYDPTASEIAIEVEP